MSKFFVTGATGFVGSHLCKNLIQSGHQVLALVRSPEKARKLFGDSIEILEGDLTLFKNLGLKIPECDQVIHLAGVVNAKSTSEYHEVNFQAVKDFVACLQRQSWRPKRFLFASSLAAAGPSGDTPHTETDPPYPIDPYGNAKLAAERFLREIDIPTTSFRPSIILGPLDTATITLYKLAQKGMAMKVGKSSQKLSFVDVDDVVDAIIKMAAEKGNEHKLYYISHPDPTDAVTIGKSIGKAMGKNVVTIPVSRLILWPAMILSTFFCKIFGLTNKLDLKQYKQIIAPAFVCSGQRLQRDLNWKPRFNLMDSLTKALKGYKQAGLL
ncbi:MAG: NAD-dependent epimerase/dehydratase family protein [Deltaproteobacteria bacterium]|nr:MAG: NAD-dependent epimerase/dehydratase family protein [Deltaproteobacteria bacterium]